MKNFFLFSAFFLSLLLVFSASWVENNFGVTSIDSILFVLRTPMTGVPGEMILSYAGQLVCAAAIALCLAGFFTMLLRGAPRPAGRLLLAAPAICLAAAVIYVAGEYQALRYLGSEISYSTFMDDHYARPDPGQIKAGRCTRNMVFLVLESMENSFHDQALFKPSLIPRLRAVQGSGIFFDRHLSGPGTTWTAAAMTAYLMGIPLKLPLEENSYDGRYSSFLPGAASVLSVLEEHDYALALVMGADSRFSGLNNMFTSHAASTVIYDRNYFAARREDGGEGMSRWGPGDKEVYALAREVVGGLGRAGKPFFTVIMTMDTHVPAKAFGDYPQPHGDARDSFVAADHMAAEFLSWLMAQPFYKDTVVLVAGDHPYMGARVGAVEFPPGYERRVFNVFLNSARKARLGLRRQLYSFDIAPSLLEAMGFRLPGGRFGLGVSLFGREATLLERYGREVLDEGLRQRSRLYDGFFGKAE